VHPGASPRPEREHHRMPAINPTTPTELENAYNAWRLAADDATDALHAWISAPTSTREAAFTAYRAALDREQQVAQILAHHAH
jgi:hypothetical protein